MSDNRKMKGSYSLTVTFVREVVDDLEVAGDNFPVIADEKELLVQQLRAEIQEAFDEGFISGNFVIHEESFKSDLTSKEFSDALRLKPDAPKPVPAKAKVKEN